MKTSTLFTSLFSLAALVSQAVGYANPGACTGQCWSHDPSVVRRASDGKYFRFETGSRIGIWKAGDLTGPWEYQGAVLPSGSMINMAGKDDLWAPDVHKVGNQYILYYTVSTSSSQTSAIGYATSPTMEKGTWTDRGSLGIKSDPSKPYNPIDANLIQDTSGNYFMTFGSFWGDIYQVPLTSTATKVAGASSNIALNTTHPQPLEGASIHARSGYYYLFFSSGACCGYDKTMPAPGEEYKIFVCRAKAATGPFVDRSGRSCRASGGTLVLASHGRVFGPGGQGVLEDGSRGSVLYYHYADRNVGMGDGEYRFGWNTLTWKDGWPSV